jgi:hypothetical protein
MQVLCMRVADGPRLLLTEGIATGVEIVVAGDLGKIGSMPPPLALVGFGPGKVFASRTRLASGVGWQRNVERGCRTHAVDACHGCRHGEECDERLNPEVPWIDSELAAVSVATKTQVFTHQPR